MTNHPEQLAPVLVLPGLPRGTSNFQVTEYNSDGSIDLNGISVNELRNYTNIRAREPTGYPVTSLGKPRRDS